MVNRKELQYLHQEEGETSPNYGVTTYRSKSAASHEESGLPSPSVDTGPAVPGVLIDIISCGCKASSKACSTGGCSCCKGHHMSCTVYCSCTAGDLCCNPLTLRNNAASSLSERDIGMHIYSDDDLDEMQLELA